MKISILTLFPKMFTGPFDHSIVKMAKEKNLVSIDFVNIRDFGIGKHKLVDDTPYGGGIGMVMRVDVVHTAIQYAKGTPFDSAQGKKKTKVVLLTASGEQFTQKRAREYSELNHLILVCGHYEGIDERISQFVDEQISIGDFVTTGGEIPAMLITDAVTRLLPGVLKEGVTETESFSLQTEDGISLEYPHYTKPQVYKGCAVPEVLLSGDHAKITVWRKEQGRARTKKVRPDLLK
ncbi:MAG: tRNA (guanosine(37)-N1)-methyltransferase TrmD [Candidatus Levybacteria bacterium]|nr:tRNA (guanosine(37)-N1)-methyltransferase TrmD [Candidatus Levybacteria bacterium]